MFSFLHQIGENTLLLRSFVLFSTFEHCIGTFLLFFRRIVKSPISLSRSSQSKPSGLIFSKYSLLFYGNIYTFSRFFLFHSCSSSSRLIPSHLFLFIHWISCTIFLWKKSQRSHFLSNRNRKKMICCENFHKFDVKTNKTLTKKGNFMLDRHKSTHTHTISERERETHAPPELKINTKNLWRIKCSS